MANMLRVRARGTGWTGAPGLTTFYFAVGVSDTLGAALADNVCQRVRNYFVALQAYFPAAITWQVDPLVTVMDPATGDTTSYIQPASAPAPVVGTALPNVIGPTPVMALGKLITNSIVSNRRIQGRTFFGPMAATFTDTQQPESGLQAALVTGLNALQVTGATLTLNCVWHRPKGASPGSMPAVVSTAAAADYAVLRSRRN